MPTKMRDRIGKIFRKHAFHFTDVLPSAMREETLVYHRHSIRKACLRDIGNLLSGDVFEAGTQEPHVPHSVASYGRIVRLEAVISSNDCEVILPVLSDPQGEIGRAHV